MNSSQPPVSVVTPVYNAEAYLAACIESVLAQTYTNWEYILVDNRSTDASRSIAESYARQDARIRVVTNAEFLPIMPNWNHALRQIDRASRYVLGAKKRDGFALHTCVGKLDQQDDEAVKIFKQQREAHPQAQHHS